MNPTKKKRKKKENVGSVHPHFQPTDHLLPLPLPLLWSLWQNF